MSKGRILVTGGLGFIGSHTIVDLIEHGYDVVSLDNELNSSVTVLRSIEKITARVVENIHVDLSDRTETIHRLRAFGYFDGIIHFAALKSVEESVYHPELYFQNNVGGSITTMALMDEIGIPHLIFSSSCTVYGSPEKLPVTEMTPLGKAESPYGASKQACEIMYDQYFNSHNKLNLHHGKKETKKSGVSLRYFNPAGAHPSALMGESPKNKATNLVPVITETAIGKRDQMMVYGNDYDTRDGSCVRDYIHIMDLARAHTLAMAHLLQNKNDSPYEVFNLGIGAGVTVLEAIHAFENATGEKVNYQLGPRRAGDVPAIYADHNHITSKMQWHPEHDINAIMTSAWQWELQRSNKARR